MFSKNTAMATLYIHDLYMKCESISAALYILMMHKKCEFIANHTVTIIILNPTAVYSNQHNMNHMIAKGFLSLSLRGLFVLKGCYYD